MPQVVFSHSYTWVLHCLLPMPHLIFSPMYTLMLHCQGSLPTHMNWPEPWIHTHINWTEPWIHTHINWTEPWIHSVHGCIFKNLRAESIVCVPPYGSGQPHTYSPALLLSLSSLIALNEHWLSHKCKHNRPWAVRTLQMKLHEKIYGKLTCCVCVCVCVCVYVPVCMHSKGGQAAKQHVAWKLHGTCISALKHVSVQIKW